MSRTLLLADDSVVIQKLVGLSFANEDVTLLTTDNGDDAVARAVEARPELVLADVVMPGKNGYEVCEAIKQNPELAHVPVLLLTGTFEAFDEERARNVGANGHITKPFEAQVLVDRVNELLNAPPPVAAAKEPAAGLDSAQAFDASGSATTSPAVPLDTATPSHDQTIAILPGDDVLASLGSADPLAAYAPREALANPAQAPAAESVFDAPAIPPAPPTIDLSADLSVDLSTDLGAGVGFDTGSRTGETSELGLEPTSEFAFDSGGGPPPLDLDVELAAEPVEATIDTAEAARLPALDLAGQASNPVVDLDTGENLIPGGAQPIAEAVELVSSEFDFSAGTALSQSEPAPQIEPAQVEPWTPLAGDSLAPQAFDSTPGLALDSPAETVLADDFLVAPNPEPSFDASAVPDPQATLLADDFLVSPVTTPAEGEAVGDLLAGTEAAAPASPPLDLPSGADADSHATMLADDLFAVQPDLDPSSEMPPSHLETRSAVDDDATASGFTASEPQEPLGVSPLDASPTPTADTSLDVATPQSLSGPDLSPMLRERLHETLEKVAWEAFAELSDQIVKQAVERVERIAWEVVPQMTEALIREEIRRMKGEDE